MLGLLCCLLCSYLTLFQCNVCITTRVWKISRDDAWISWYRQYRTRGRIARCRLSAFAFPYLILIGEAIFSHGVEPVKLSGSRAAATQFVSLGCMRFEILGLEGEGALVRWINLLLIFPITIYCKVLLCWVHQSWERSCVLFANSCHLDWGSSLDL